MAQLRQIKTLSIVGVIFGKNSSVWHSWCYIWEKFICVHYHTVFRRFDKVWKLRKFSLILFWQRFIPKFRIFYSRVYKRNRQMYNFIKMAGTSREKQYHVAATGNNWLYLVRRVFGGISRLELSLSKRRLSKSVRKCFSKKNECEKYLTIFMFGVFNQRSKKLSWTSWTILTQLKHNLLSLSFCHKS